MPAPLPAGTMAIHAPNLPPGSMQLLTPTLLPKKAPKAPAGSVVRAPSPRERVHPLPPAHCCSHRRLPHEVQCPRAHHGAHCRERRAFTPEHGKAPLTCHGFTRLLPSCATGHGDSGGTGHPRSQGLAHLHFPARKRKGRSPHLRPMPPATLSCPLQGGGGQLPQRWAEAFA